MFLTGSVTAQVAAWIDGTQYKRIGPITTSTAHVFSDTIYLEKGENLTFRLTSNATLSSSALVHHVSITSVQSPQTLYGGEVVAARYTSTDSTSLTSNTWTKVDFNVSTFDTHSSVSSGTFTAPASGYYRVSASLTFVSSSFDGSTEVSGTAIYKNGSVSVYSQSLAPSNASSGNIVLCTDILYLNKGDTIDIYGLQASGAGLAQSTFAGANHFSIEKIN